MAARVPAHGLRRRTAIATTLALTAIVSAPLLEYPVVAQSAAAPASGSEPLDFDAIYKIKDEAVNRSQVMETLSYLTDVHGPRLTNSPNMRTAAEWTKKRLEGYGLSNVALEAWGPFGRGWVNERMLATMTAPQSFPLLAFPKAWTPGTNGLVKGDAVLAIIDKADDFKKWEGKLKGKIVLVSPSREVPAFFASPTRRWEEKALTDLTRPALSRSRFGGPGGPGGPGATADFRRQRMAFFIKEGVLALVEMSSGARGDNGAVVVQAPPEGENQRQPTDAAVLPQIVVAGEHYGRLLRVLDKQVPVALELDVKNRFVDGDLNSLNVIAELPGSDKADEVVMIGAHFDSWHSGTGATDNGVSSAVMIEAMRILKAAPSAWGCGPARSRACSARAPTSPSTSPTAPTWW
jgi:carboxypeptidase Q